MIKAVLFDFDGTMMNTREGIISSWKHIFKTVEGREVDEEFLQNTFGEPLVDSLAKFFPKLPVEESLEIYRDYQRKHHGEMMVPFDGIVKTIKALKERNIKLGVVTSRGEASTSEGLKNAGIYQYFDTIITANSCEKHKPEPEPIWLALDNLNIDKDEAVMVGDTMYDLKSARNAGVKSILVGWSKDVQKLEDAGAFAPDFVIEKAEDILEIVEVK